MKKIIGLVLFCVSLNLVAQEDIYPIYKGCDEAESSLESCFNQRLSKDVLDKFVLPEKVKSDGYKGTINVIFLVKASGDFEVLYVRSAYAELEAEVKRVFAMLPKARPATFNGRPIEMRFGMPIQIPLGSYPPPETITKETKTSIVSISKAQQDLIPPIQEAGEDINNVVASNFFPEHHSELNIPFTHRTYDELNFYFDQNSNSHTGFKPYQYSEASKYIDLDTQKSALFKEKSSSLGKKLWNEHFFKVEKKDYWFTINPVVDLQLGTDNSDNDYTYNNTRAIHIQGGLGKGFNFSASIYESQGRFASYINDFAIANRPSGASSFGLVPGRGKAKDFKETGFDYPVAEAYLSYTPNKFFNFQFGHGKNFIGDGYRSMMLSDVSTPYPYFKISTDFWKIKYTNLWMWLEDVRPSVSENGLSSRKYVALHHLSWNVNKRLNIGLFEAAITNNEGGNGFDINYFNPIIFYRAVEFSRGSGGGNAVIGLSGKYKVTKNISAYSQFVLDELTVGKFFNGDGYWGNKFALQFGAKYYNAFNIEDLYLQGELNIARPYTFSHKDPSLNYGHYNQPLGHLWGSNFSELIGITRYKNGRWFANAKLVIGAKGFDRDGINYGGDIYASNEDRIGDYGNKLLQGNKTNLFIADLQGGYVVNPTTNLQLFAGINYRSMNPEAITTGVNDRSTWFTFGLKTDLFNWYFDF
ncbi:gliding motility protein RemB [Flavobacteriaceae bacterium F08102]|nr:gliding motility protein RemB [Flavobacteriaceae bacterium F08102]